VSLRPIIGEIVTGGRLRVTVSEAGTLTRMVSPSLVIIDQRRRIREAGATA
jgi:hypothetical protein